MKSEVHYHGPNEGLHVSTQTEYQVQSGLLPDVVVGQSAAVLELLTGEDQTLNSGLMTCFNWVETPAIW
jgi:hypothetical protein